MSISKLGIEFKDIEGYEGKYSVSSDGRVWSHQKYRFKGKFLTPFVSIRGYELLGMSKNKKRHTFSVHRLVAKAFIPNPNNKPEVNHKDGNKTNNHISNLEWVTSSENQIHAVESGLCNFSEKHKETAKRIGKINGSKNKGKIFKSRKLSLEQDKEIIYRFNNGESSLKLAKEFGVSKKTILNIKNGRVYKGK